jgi:steroid delta-isomerase-like uncharacterized protein
MSKRLWSIALSAALVVGVGCKKEEAEPAKKPGSEKKVDKTPPTPPKPVTLAGADLAKLYLDCWGAFNAADWAKFTACYAADSSSTWVDTGMPDAMGAKAIVDTQAKPFRDAFPDMKGDVQVVLLNGRNVFSVALMQGTHTGVLKSPMGDIPATGKKVGYLVAHGVTFNEENQVTKEWFFQDMGTMMFQLGLSPGPARPVMEKGMEGAPMVVVAADSDAEKANVAAWQKDLEAFNKHDAKALLANSADDVIESDQASPMDMKGKKDIEKGVGDFFKAFSDIKIEPTSTWGAGDYVVSVGTLTGTNDGDMKMMKMKATKKPIKIQFVEIVKYDGGKVKQIWRFYNGMAFMAQLGLLPEPPKGEAPKGEAPKGEAPKGEAPVEKKDK